MTCPYCGNSKAIGHSMYCPYNTMNSERIDEVYSKMLPIVNGEKEGQVDEDDLYFIEGWWLYLFKIGTELPTAKLDFEVLDRVYDKYHNL